MKGSGAAVSSRQTQKGSQAFIDISFPTANKPFHLDILHALHTRARKKNKIIPFPEAFRILSWWKIRKEERFDVLGDLQQAGFLRLVMGHGIILEKTKKVYFCQDLKIYLDLSAFCNEAECGFSSSCDVPGNRGEMEP